VAGAGAASATRLGLGGGTRGGGGAGVALSPCGRLEIVGLCSGDSAGGASLPRGGGLRCCELLLRRFESVADGGADAAAGADDAAVAGGLGAGAGCGDGGEAAGGGDGGGGEAGAEEIIAELAGAFDERGVVRAGGAGGGTVLATSPARRLSALYCALLRSATRLFTSLSRSTPLSCVSGGDGTVPRLG